MQLAAGYSLFYDFDPTGRMDAISYNAGGMAGETQYHYLPDSDLIEQATGHNGLTATYTYEPHRNLKTRVENHTGTGLVSQYDYTYDAVGRRASAANSGSAFAVAAFSRYDYNDRSELIEAGRFWGTDITDTTTPSQPEYRSYDYDPIGNRTDAVTGTEHTGYDANALNQYSAITGAHPQAQVYDADGNLTSAFGMTYTYNAENRLITVEPDTSAPGDKRLAFTYDYMGRRVRKQVYEYTPDTWNLKKEILFVYDGWNLVKESINRFSEGTNTRYYVWGMDLSQSLQGAGGVGGLLACADAGDSVLLQYIYDANGNVGQVLNAATGALSAHYEYDPYGNVVRSAGSGVEGNVYRFSTKYTDEESGLIYYGYRYYSPQLGRWINRDPIGEEGGFNLYGFVGNDGINGNDYLGKYNWPCFFACWLGFDEDIFKAMREKNPDLLSRKNRRWLEKEFFKENKDKIKGMSKSAAKKFRKTWLPKKLRNEGIKKVHRVAWRKFGKITGSKAATWAAGTAIGAGAGAPLGGVGAVPGAAVGFVVSTAINIVSGYGDLKEICHCAWTCK